MLADGGIESPITASVVPYADALVVPAPLRLRGVGGSSARGRRILRFQSQSRARDCEFPVNLEISANLASWGVVAYTGNRAVMSCSSANCQQTAPDCTV